MQTKLIKRLIIATALCGALTTAANATELRFTVWTGSQPHLDMLNAIAAGFAETHPDVTVKFDTIPFNDYVQKITLQLAGGNPPDLGWLLENSGPAFVDAGTLVDVSKTLNDTAGYDYADFSKPAMGLWTSGDAVYGVPFSTSPFLIYYNKSLYDAAGLETPSERVADGSWTWEQLKADAAALRDADAGIWGYETVDGQGYGARVMHNLMPIVRAYGGEAWSDGTCTLNSDDAVEAVTLFHDMVYKDGSTVPPGEQGDFFSGKSALTMTQLSRVSKLADAGFDWGIVPLPKGPAGDAQTVGQAAIVAFAQGKNKELAAEFLAYMTDKDNVAKMAEFFPPARKSVLQSEAFLSSNPAVTPEQMEIVAAGIEAGSVLPNSVNYPQIEAEARPDFDALWAPDANVKAVLDKLCKDIQPLLK
ncbi:sugar ABC transporter substrate-binding protein [Martelella sp. HB161492]|uniref:ABC transporter substrate-binding protein n=1 Tax=Martelella sp. HB161492 TaxID=2720726 RepID=UPI00159190A4|nr:sugar ABC transporter substrate-binding protein [Martelella sp. HB161492]